MIFSHFFFANNEMFFVIFHPKLAKKNRNIVTKFTEDTGCFATVLQLLQFISGLYTPFLCVKIASFLIKLHCSG